MILTLMIKDERIVKMNQTFFFFFISLETEYQTHLSILDQEIQTLLIVWSMIMLSSNLQKKRKKKTLVW